MESGSDRETDEVTLSTFEERLDELCVYYMSMGVPYDTFWYGDPCCLKYYEEMYLRQRKIHNEEAWMQGVYNFAAHQTSLGNAFRGKGHAPSQYLKEPIAFFPKTEQELAVEERKKREQTVAYLNAWAEAWNRKNGSERSRDSESTNQDNGQHDRGGEECVESDGGVERSTVSS